MNFLTTLVLFNYALIACEDRFPLYGTKQLHFLLPFIMSQSFIVTDNILKNLYLILFKNIKQNWKPGALCTPKMENGWRKLLPSSPAAYLGWSLRCKCWCSLTIADWEPFLAPLHLAPYCGCTKEEDISKWGFGELFVNLSLSRRLLRGPSFFCRLQRWGQWAVERNKVIFVLFLFYRSSSLFKYIGS